MSRIHLAPTSYVKHIKYTDRKGNKRYACLVTIHHRAKYLRVAWRTATQADIYGERVVARYQRMLKVAQKAEKAHSGKAKNTPQKPTGRRTSHVQTAK